MHAEKIIIKKRNGVQGIFEAIWVLMEGNGKGWEGGGRGGGEHG